MEAVEVRLRPENGALPGIDAALAATSAVTREALLRLAWLADDTSVLLYRLSTDDPGALEDLLSAHPEVLRGEVIADGTTRVHAFVHVAPRDLFGELLGIVERHPVFLDPPVRFTDDDIVVTVVGDASGLGEAFEAGTDVLPVTVEWTGEYTPDAPDAVGRLTDRQREALEVAHDLGFYEQPRRADYEDIAAGLECAPSTANELLRRAEAALVGAMLG